MKMKKLLMILVLMMGLMSCGWDVATVSAHAVGKDRVEVVYSHGKQRCATCVAIEKNARKVVNSKFSSELKNGTVVFKLVDISAPEGEKIATDMK